MDVNVTFMVQFSPRRNTVLVDLVVFHDVVTLNASQGISFASTRPESTQYNAAKTPPMRVVFKCFVTASETIGFFVVQHVFR